MTDKAELVACQNFPCIIKHKKEVQPVKQVMPGSYDRALDDGRGYVYVYDKMGRLVSIKDLEENEIMEEYIERYISSFLIEYKDEDIFVLRKN